MNFIADCLKKFRQLPEKTQEIIGGLKTLSIIIDLEKRYGIELSFTVILIAIGKLSPDNLSEYLIKKFHLSEEDAYEVKAGLINDVFSALNDDVVVNIELIKNTKKDLILSLKSNLLSVFLTSNQAEIENYNYLFVRVWNENNDFHLEAQNALLANQEKISNAKIEVDGRIRTATISGLLKNFVKKYGLEANDLNIAEFVSSPALKDFSDEEKALSLRILKFFRNINKLDEYLAQQKAGRIEGFEVLPLAANQSASQPDTVIKSAPVIKTEPVVAPIIPAAEPVVAAPATLANGLAAELEMMLQDYAPGSLEYKTLQQELKRLLLKK